jgi:lipoyl(octanoyl) transferase
VRRWITYHGVSLNRDPDISHFQGIVPCGVADRGVTSLAALGVRVSAEELDAALRASFDLVFG